MILLLPTMPKTWHPGWPSARCSVCDRQCGAGGWGLLRLWRRLATGGNPMLLGSGSTTQALTTDAVQRLLAQTFDALPLDGKRVLVIIPDGTRTAPIPLLFRLLYAQLGPRVARLDYLIAL